MKPIYLEFCGINSFSEKASIDFKALMTGGVFGIFGDTGSGKSTILDCIHLALYGVVSRASGSECINHALDSAYVSFDFEIKENGERHAYRVRRERKRKNNVAKAWLYELDEHGKQTALAEGTRDVNDKLREIVRLTFEDFKMCIALPQGDFAALVKSAPSERIKLVSRLFDLEKYGEKLWGVTSAKYAAAKQECELARAKMGQNEEGSEEAIAELETKLAQGKALLERAEQEEKDAEEQYAAWQALQKEKRAYDELCARLERLTAQLPAMQKRRDLLEKIPLARAVKTALELVADNAETTEKAAQDLEKTEREIAQTLLDFERAKTALEQGGYEEKIQDLTLSIERIKGAAADFQAETDAERNWQASKKELQELQEKCPQEDFDASLQACEKRIAELDADENFLDYLKHNCKDVFLGEAYAEFRADLRGLQERHPQTQADVALLLEKYTPSKTDGAAVDVALMQTEYKRKQQQVKRLKEELETLQKRKLDYAANEQKKAFALEKVNAYQAMLETARAKTEAVKRLGALSDLESKLEKWKKSRENAKKVFEKAQESLQKLRTQSAQYKALYESGKLQARALNARLAESVESGGFADYEQALALLRSLGDEQQAKDACQEFFEEYALCKNKAAETDGSKFVKYDETGLERARANALEKKTACEGLRRELTVAETERKRLQMLREKYLTFAEELKKAEQQKQLYESIRTMLTGNKFLDFIACEYLQDICVGASTTLLSLTGGRYFLRYDKEFLVGDNLDGGNLRAVKTLSGGETFLVSLSLALSLSSAICLRSQRPIEFFFLDEGFGTLDGRLVDTVMDVLGKLSKDFAVGLISHVEELKHRIENKILVTGATKTHGSQLKAEHF